MKKKNAPSESIWTHFFNTLHPFPLLRRIDPHYYTIKNDSLSMSGWVEMSINQTKCPSFNSTNCQKLPLHRPKNKRTLIQVNLCQKLLFLHQLTQNMTTDCLLNYKFHTWKFLAQTWEEHVVYRNFFDIQNNFCTQHVLPIFCKKKSFWQRFTCTAGILFSCSL